MKNETLSFGTLLFIYPQRIKQFPSSTTIHPISSISQPHRIHAQIQCNRIAYTQYNKIQLGFNAMTTTINWFILRWAFFGKMFRQVATICNRNLICEIPISFLPIHLFCLCWICELCAVCGENSINSIVNHFSSCPIHYISSVMFNVLPNSRKSNCLKRPL